MLQLFAKKANHCYMDDMRNHKQAYALQIHHWPSLLIGCLVCLVCCPASSQSSSDLKLNDYKYWQHDQDSQRLHEGNMLADEAELQKELNDYVEYFQRVRFNQGGQNLEEGENLLLTVEDFCSRFPAECRIHKSNNWVKCNGFALLHVSGGTQTANCLPYPLLQDKAIAKIAVKALRNRQYLDAQEALLEKLQSELTTTSLEMPVGNGAESDQSSETPSILAHSDPTELYDSDPNKMDPGSQDWITNRTVLEQSQDRVFKTLRTTATTTEAYIDSGGVEAADLSNSEQRHLDGSQGGPSYGRITSLGTGRHYRSGHQLDTRAWRLLGSTPGSKTYRVSAEEARDFIQAQQNQAGDLSNQDLPYSNKMHLFPLVRKFPSSTKYRSAAPKSQEEHLDNKLASDQSIGGGSSGSVRLHRSESSLLEATGRQLEHMMAASGHRKRLHNNHGDLVPGKMVDGATTSSPAITQHASTESGPSGDNQQFGCNKRLFTFRAVKHDSMGNHCSGLIRATICYGSCDTGEISDWLFPGKKSIHKVCRHGQRIRRHTTLTDCNRPDVDPSLRSYHHVDAADCVCKKCTSTNTTCLGTMSRPHLQTLDEAVASLGAATDLEY